MIELDRREAARFRAAVRRCVAGRPRGLAPPVVIQQNEDGLTLSAVLDEVVIALRLLTSGGPTASLVVPFSTLAALDGPGGGVVTFESRESGAVHCRWQERGESKELHCEPVSPDAQPASLPAVGNLHAVNPSFLVALHACGQTASRETDGRFATNRLQLRGQSGEVAGTDGRQLLLCGGFTFPSQENLLVPAVPVFGARELAGAQDVCIGRTGKHFAVVVGPWTIWLAIDATSRYPDVTAVVPRSSRMSKLLIDEVDAAALLQDLQKGPTSGDEVVPVVLDLGPRPALRWSEGTVRRRGPLSLIRSMFSGAPTSVRLDPKFLARALSLGFREVRTASAEAPVLFRDENRSYLVANLAPVPAPVATSADRQALPAPRSIGPLAQQGEDTMNPENNGGPQADNPATDDVLDPLTEAEALRAALAEVARRVGRLIASLRQFQKQRRALQTAWTSLKHLRLGPREEP